MPSTPHVAARAGSRVSATTETGERGGRGADRRTADRILAAALEEFANRGFDGATTTAIARRAGVTQPLVHYHFATKDELWRAVVGAEAAQLIAHFAKVGDELGDLGPVERLKVVVRRLVHFMADHPEFGRILSYEGVQGGPRHEWVLGLGDGQLRALDALIAAGVAEGWAKPLPAPHVASCITAAAAYFFIVRATVRDVYGLDPDDPAVVRDHADTVVELIFHGLVRADTEVGG